VEDGDLRRYDDPDQAQILSEINSGYGFFLIISNFAPFLLFLFLIMSITSRAPPSILNVLPGQPVEVRVTRRTEEDYVFTPRMGFAGSGSRLGGVVPETESAIPFAPQVAGMPGAFPPSITSASGLVSTSTSAAPPLASRTRDPESVATRFSVDQTLPTTSVQVRLADGTRFERSPWHSLVLQLFNLFPIITI